jgi:hypothetical protein
LFHWILCHFFFYFFIPNKICYFLDFLIVLQRPVILDRRCPTGQFPLAIDFTPGLPQAPLPPLALGFQTNPFPHFPSLDRLRFFLLGLFFFELAMSFFYFLNKRKFVIFYFSYYKTFVLKQSLFLPTALAKVF